MSVENATLGTIVFSGATLLVCLFAIAAIHKDVTSIWSELDSEIVSFKVKTDDLWKEMIGLGAATPSNRLRRQAGYNIHNKGKKTSGSGYDTANGGSSNYGSSSSSGNYGTSNNDGDNRYDSGGANYGDTPPTVVGEMYNNPYRQEGSEPPVNVGDNTYRKPPSSGNSVTETHYGASSAQPGQQFHPISGSFIPSGFPKNGWCVCSLENTCPPGPPGPKGEKGVDGKNGIPGKDGMDGIDAENIQQEGPSGCFHCPEGPPGPPGSPGRPGIRGQRGPKGVPGLPGRDGNPGQPGDIGSPGPPGPDGKPGEPGEKGADAEKVVGRKGNRGPPGDQGPEGPPGDKGKDAPPGKPGPEGPQGQPGFQGPQGSDGEEGPEGPPGNPGKDAEYCPCPPREQSTAHRLRPDFGRSDSSESRMDETHFKSDEESGSFGRTDFEENPDDRNRGYKSRRTLL